jgi:hypothetical protein
MGILFEEDNIREAINFYFECVILTIEITGRVAAAKVRESSHEGAVIDYFHLLNDGNRWSIVSKL